MDKRQFLEAVTEQIRFEKAREMISDELENHIEDQKEAFMSEGISETESYQKAIEDMGDPVEVGISLDRIHRPKMEWKMILLVLGLSILGLFFQYVIFLIGQLLAVLSGNTRQYCLRNGPEGLCDRMFQCFLRRNQQNYLSEVHVYGNSLCAYKETV